ncbi:MAG: class I SAM-dependent methyltransferase, partial [Chloroflexota bacterium]
MSSTAQASHFAEIETVNCNLCGSDKSEVLYTLEDWAYETAGKHTLVQCECGLVYLNPRPTLAAMGHYYPQNYIPFRAASPPQGSLRQRWYYRKWRARCLQVLDACQSGRILDVGCSSGLFLQALQQFGDWETHGIEVNKEMAQLARQNGAQVVEDDLSAAGYPDAYFDVVTLWDVFEHVHDPKMTMQEIVRILKPGGTLFISVPNLDSHDAKLFRTYWIGFDTPRHLYIYNAATLRRYLALDEMSIEKIYSFYGRYTAFALSLNSWLKQYIKSRQMRRYLQAFLFFPFWRYATFPYFWLLDQFGL